MSNEAKHKVPSKAMCHSNAKTSLLSCLHNKTLEGRGFQGFLFMSIFMDSEKAPTVQVGAFAEIYFADSAAGRCHSIRPLSFKSSSTSVPLAFFITALSSIFSLNESFISVIGFLSIA